MFFGAVCVQAYIIQQHLGTGIFLFFLRTMNKKGGSNRGGNMLEPHAAHACNGWIRQHTIAASYYNGRRFRRPQVVGAHRGAGHGVASLCHRRWPRLLRQHRDERNFARPTRRIDQHGTRLAVDGPRAMDIRYYYYCHTSFFANAAAMPSSAVSVCVVWCFLPAGGTSRRSS